MYIIYGERDHQPRLDAWDKCSGLVHWEDPEGLGIFQFFFLHLVIFNQTFFGNSVFLPFFKHLDFIFYISYWLP